MAASADLEFKGWARRWMELARFSGRELPDAEGRIASVVALWHESIPPGWERERDPLLLDRRRRYRRGNDGVDGVRRGEHAIEYDLLNPSPAHVATNGLGARLVDGVNAVPLAKDIGGGRSGNVEADMLLLVRDENEYRLLLVEVKTRSNNAWFAVVENLRQLRLFSESPETQVLFHERCLELGLPQSLPVTAVVLAPHSFYTARGAKAESVAPVEKLLRRMRDAAGVDVQLATWESNERAIEPWASSP